MNTTALEISHQDYDTVSRIYLDGDGRYGLHEAAWNVAEKWWSREGRDLDLELSEIDTKLAYTDAIKAEVRRQAERLVRLDEMHEYLNGPANDGRPYTYVQPVNEHADEMYALIKPAMDGAWQRFDAIGKEAKEHAFSLQEMDGDGYLEVPVTWVRFFY